MTYFATVPSSQGAVVAFDRMAASYDVAFTESLIGRAQREVVWDLLKRVFHRGDRILELNCGTGEDALFLVRRGVSVVAYDASPRMIEVANQRQVPDGAGVVQFGVLKNEHVSQLGGTARFDGLLSNFSGLNCVENLPLVAAEIARLLRTGGTAVLCMSTRVCAWEIAWYGTRANFPKAFRRLRGKTIAQLDGAAVPVWYPTIGQISRVFSPWFELRSARAVGLFVPPSYLEGSARKYPRALKNLQALDRVFSAWPILRTLGDHILLEFVKARSS